MLMFVLLIFLTSSIEVPKYQYIDILNQGDQCYNEEDNELIENKPEFRKLCSTNPPIYGGQEMCNAVADAKLINKCYYVSEEETIDTILAKIDPSVEILIIENQAVTAEQTINFNNLPKKMHIIYNQRQYYVDEENRESGTLHLVGNIKDKVSSLAIKNVKLDVIESDLDIDTLIIGEGSEILTETSKKILTNYYLSFLPALSEQKTDFSQLATIVQTKSFQIFEQRDILEKNTLVVLYASDHLTISTNNPDSQESYSINLPYSLATTMGVLTVAESVTLNTESTYELPDNFALNLTFKKFFSYGGPDGNLYWDSGEEVSFPTNYPISFKKGNDWTDGSSKPKITIDTDNKVFKVDTSEVDSIVDITKINDDSESGDEQESTINDSNQSPNDDPNQSPNDDPNQSPTPDSGITPDDILKDDDIKTVKIDSNEKASEIITNAFNDKQLGWSDSKDNVILLDSAIKDITLNLNLKDNQFIAAKSGTNIDLQGGNLNLLISNKKDIITVKADTSKDVMVSVKGGGTLKVEPKDSSSSNAINFKSKIQLNSTFAIEVVSDAIKSVVLDSVLLYKSAKGTESIDIKCNNKAEPIIVSINNIEAHKESVAALTNANINEKLSIDQPASLTLNNVGLKTSQILMNLNSKSDKSQPLIQGNLKEIPDAFVINKMEGDLTANSDYSLIKAIFNCNDWQSKLDLGKSGFNQKKCRDVNKDNAYLLEEKVEELYISKSEEKKKKLSTGAIIGIVIGCVAAVAIIVVVVVVVVKRKKKVQGASPSNSP